MAKEKETKIPEKPVVQIVGFGDLPDRDITVFVEMADNQLAFPCRTLTYKRFNELGRLIPDPEPPFDAGPKGRIYHLQDPAYLAKFPEVADKRMYYRLAEFLRLPIPGETMAEKAAYLSENLEYTIVKALIEAMQQNMLEGKAHVEARAATFHSNGLSHSEDLPTE